MAVIKYLFITALTAVICSKAVISSPLLDKAEEYRLNNKFTPLNYKIDLTTNIIEATTEGEVKIIINTFDETNTLRFHSKDLTVDQKDVSLVKNTETENHFSVPNKKKVEIKGMVYHEPGQFYELELKTKLEAKTNYILTIKFKGVLNKDGNGFYLLDLKPGNAEKDNVMAVTHMYAVYARTVFPCFDEPELKATFDITLTHDEDYEAFSNSNPLPKSSKTVQAAAKTVTTKFSQTPLMSTYLVAFALLPKDAFVNHPADKRTNVLVRKDVKDQVTYLLPKTTSYLKALEKLTGVEYDKALGKITHLAIPRPEAGAMENWGLIIYGEPGVLYDVEREETSKKLNGQRAIAHELSHQWFGNLVTLKWWTDLWLQEGFASYMESVVMDDVSSNEFGTLKEYFAQMHHSNFKLDSLSNNRAMNEPVETPEEILANFDMVQYEKGAQFLYMLEHIIGSEIFKKGVQNYIKINQRGSVTPDDLWKALQQIIDKEKTVILDDKKVADIGNSWISKAGYPVVHVAFDSNKGKLKLTQKRFLTDSKKKDKTLWMVPINFITDKTKVIGNTAPTHWLEEKTLEVENIKDIKFVIANNEQTGYYRVNYDDNNWKAISDHLNSRRKKPVVSTVTQAQLLDDAFTFAENGDLKYEIAFELTKFLKKVDTFLPWKPISAYLINVYDKISMTPTLMKYQKYLGELTKKALKKITFDTHDKNTDGILQDKLLPLMVRVRSSEFSQKSEEIMNKLKDKSSTVLKKFKRYVFCGAASTELEYLIEQLNAKKSDHDTDDILFGLSCLSDIDEINKALEEIKNKEHIFKFVKALAELSPLIVYDNNEEFKKVITDEKQVEEIMMILAGRVGTDEQLQMLEELNEDGKYDELLKMAKENHKWNTNHKDLHDWVDENVDPKPTPTPTPTSTPTEDPEVTSSATTPEDITEPDTESPGGNDGAFSVAVCLSMLISTVIIAFLM